MECRTVVAQTRAIVSQLGALFARKFREMLCVWAAEVCQVLAVERALLGVRCVPCFIGRGAPGTSFLAWIESGLFRSDTVHTGFAICRGCFALGALPVLGLLGLCQFNCRIAQRISDISGSTYEYARRTFCIGAQNHELLRGLGNQQNLENFRFRRYPAMASSMLSVVVPSLYANTCCRKTQTNRGALGRKECQEVPRTQAGLGYRVHCEFKLRILSPLMQNHMDIIVASGLLADNFQAMLLTIASAQGEDLRKIAKTLAGE